MQQNGLMKKTAAYTVLFAICALTAIFYYSSNKITVVADLAQDEAVQDTQEAEADREQNAETGDQQNAAGVQDTQTGNDIIFEENEQEMTFFCIPLHADVRAESVMVENRYMDKELWVSIKQDGMTEKCEEFYRTQGVYGNRDTVVDGCFESGDDIFWLKFSLTDVYEFHSIFESNKLYIEFIPPKEAYERIVVIDPAYGGNITGAASENLEGKKVTLDIARTLKEKLEQTDIKVYYTRMDDSAPSDENRIELTNATKADMLIRIEVNENEDSKIYGTEAVYNSKFFIPGFGSVELADLLEREVVTAISGKANGLVESTESDVVINKATVPAATIRVGYLSNGQEAILLNREDYIEKIAEGIYQAIMAAYN